MPIDARFHSLRDTVLATVDAKFAEPIRLSPMKSSRTDPARPQIIIEAVLRVSQKDNSNKMNSGRGGGWFSSVESDKSELYIDPVRWPGLVVRVGDKVRALSRPGEPAFEVAATDDRSHTRLVLQLTEV